MHSYRILLKNERHCDSIACSHSSYHVPFGVGEVGADRGGRSGAGAFKKVTAYLMNWFFYPRPLVFNHKLYAF